MTDPTFTQEQVEAAIEHVAENRAAAMHYALVFDAAGLPAPQLLHQGDEPQTVSINVPSKSQQHRLPLTEETFSHAAI